jgi:probable phosphoglycerate mutase
VTRVVLVRHGESTSTVERRIGGHRTCTGLSALGRRQAQALRDRLAQPGELPADVLVASGYRRAQETAEIIQPALGLPIEVDDALGEHDPGPDCDGLSFDEFVARFGEVDWSVDPYLRGFPGGETIADFNHRVGAGFARLVARHEGRRIVLVCHAGVISVVVRMCLHAPLTGGFELSTWSTSLTELERLADRRWRLYRYNDIGHLRGVPLATNLQHAGA